MPQPGEMLGGRYRLDDRIAAGGMGEVWRATDTVLGRAVAVKMLLAGYAGDAGFRSRFEHEARAMAALRHAGVAPVYDYGDSGDGAYLVMARVDGQPLDRRIAEGGPLSPAETMSVVAQAGHALAAAHEAGIVHRDVKPGNLIIEPGGAVVLVDFGVARSASSVTLTGVREVVGTALYIAPEQVAKRPLGPAVDIYALGAVAYHCLTGHPPFTGDNPLAVALQHLEETPPPLPGSVPAPVRALVDTALAKEPEARFASATAMAEAAERAGAGLGWSGTATSAGGAFGAASGGAYGTAAGSGAFGAAAGGAYGTAAGSGAFGAATSGGSGPATGSGAFGTAGSGATAAGMGGSPTGAGGATSAFGAAGGGAVGAASAGGAFGAAPRGVPHQGTGSQRDDVPRFAPGIAGAAAGAAAGADRTVAVGAGRSPAVAQTRTWDMPDEIGGTRAPAGPGGPGAPPPPAPAPGGPAGRRKLVVASAALIAVLAGGAALAVADPFGLFSDPGPKATEPGVVTPSKPAAPTRSSPSPRGGSDNGGENENGNGDEPAEEAPRTQDPEPTRTRSTAPAAEPPAPTTTEPAPEPTTTTPTQEETTTEPAEEEEEEEPTGPTDAPQGAEEDTGAGGTQ